MAAPRKHPPQDAAEIIKSMAAQGHSQIGIAAHLKVVSSTLRRWLEEDEKLSEAYELGKETERQALHSLIVQSAVAGKPANANAMFLLKARHGYREFDSPHAKVDVAVAVSNVMVIKDHGTDEEWAAKVAAQQRALIQPALMPITPQLQAPQTASHEAAESVACIRPVDVSVAVPVAPRAPSWQRLN